MFSQVFFMWELFLIGWYVWESVTFLICFNLQVVCSELCAGPQTASIIFVLSGNLLCSPFSKWKSLWFCSSSSSPIHMVLYCASSSYHIWDIARLVLSMILPKAQLSLSLGTLTDHVSSHMSTVCFSLRENRSLWKKTVAVVVPQDITGGCRRESM